MVRDPRLCDETRCPGAESNHRHCDFQSLAKVGRRVPGRLKNGCFPPYFLSWHPPGVSENSRTFREHLRTFTQDLHTRPYRRSCTSPATCTPAAIPPELVGRQSMSRESARPAPPQEVTGPRRHQGARPCAISPTGDGVVS